MTNAQDTRQKVVKTRLPTKYGAFSLHLFEEAKTKKEHLALVMGDITQGEEPVLTRLHSECLTGEVFGSLRCDCQWQLQNAMKEIAELGRGVIVYLRQEGRGIGLRAKLEAYNLQDLGLDTVEANIKLGFHADLRDYQPAADILKSLGVSRVSLISNNPIKAQELANNGIAVEGTVPSLAEPNDENRRYLQTKATQLGHSLPIE